MAMAIVAATTMEMRAILAGIPDPLGTPETCSAIDLREGGAAAAVVLAAKPCLLLATGVGPINAALAMGAFLASHPAPDLVLNLGIAGSFDMALAPMGRLVLASAEVWPEYGVVGGQSPDSVDPKALRLAQARDPRSGAAIWDRIELDAPSLAAPLGLRLPAGLASGVSLTVAGVTGDPARAKRLRERHQALSENMEGFSLALACNQARIPFFEIRAISNPVGSRAREDWDIKAALNALTRLGATLFAA